MTKLDKVDVTNRMLNFYEVYFQERGIEIQRIWLADSGFYDGTVDVYVELGFGEVEQIKGRIRFEDSIGVWDNIRWEARGWLIRDDHVRKKYTLKEIANKINYIRNGHIRNAQFKRHDYRRAIDGALGKV
jgi:hypothetical protein